MGQRNFTLTVMIIIMALLAIFVGYLLGNWLIQVVTGDPVDPQHVLDREDPSLREEEIIEDPEREDTETEEIPPDLERPSDSPDETEETKYMVQVGAFSELVNAERLKKELEEKGFDPDITTEAPFRVRLGSTDEREEAEETLERVQQHGFEAFITH